MQAVGLLPKIIENLSKGDFQTQETAFAISRYREQVARLIKDGAIPPGVVNFASTCPDM